MAREDAVRTQGRIVTALRPTLFRVMLGNGHCLLGYLSSRRQYDGVDYQLGDQVIVEVSPFDLSKGTILEKLNGKLDL